VQLEEEAEVPLKLVAQTALIMVEMVNLLQ
jgi:hypothetical protein